MKIHYQINLERAKEHIIQVTLKINMPLEARQEFWLPDWIPGSYMIRDFSKNLITLNAFDGNKEISLNKSTKSRWSLSEKVEQLCIEYDIYAWDLSVRSAHFDEQHCFFNGTSVFLAVEGFESEIHHVSIQGTEHSKSENWNVATSLPVDQVTSTGFGNYSACSYEQLIDHPFEIADFQAIEFRVQNTHHRMVFTEAPKNIDLNRIALDVQKICEYECTYFGDEKPPFDDYLFMTFVMKQGFGGLEHLSSTALHCSISDLPIIGDDPSVKDKDYQKFLSLCCHEYFHSWNVKRIKPEKFKPLSLQSEINTELLWFFEGITSYIDELFLIRAKVVDISDYLDMLAKTISRYYKGNGRLRQSVTASSFDAWTKFYQQDENAPNAITSYYVKGSLIALLLDFEIREISQNQLSLDDLMRHIWQDFGKTGIGVGEKDIQLSCEKMLSHLLQHTVCLDKFFKKHLYSISEIELEPVFKKLGINFLLVSESKQSDSGGYVKNLAPLIKAHKIKPSLSITHQANAIGAQIKSVINGGSASVCGLSNKDIIIAVNDLRVTSTDLDATIKQYNIDEVIKISYFRRDRLYQKECLLTQSKPNTCYLSLGKDETKFQQNSLLKSWIGA